MRHPSSVRFFDSGHPSSVIGVRLHDGFRWTVCFGTLFSWTCMIARLEGKERDQEMEELQQRHQLLPAVYQLLLALRVLQFPSNQQGTSSQGNASNEHFASQPLTPTCTKRITAAANNGVRGGDMQNPFYKFFVWADFDSAVEICRIFGSRFFVWANSFVIVLFSFSFSFPFSFLISLEDFVFDYYYENCLLYMKNRCLMSLFNYRLLINDYEIDCEFSLSETTLGYLDIEMDIGGCESVNMFCNQLFMISVLYCYYVCKY
ncbi:hypothetical protein ACOSP7_031906 [Xanthoceras sorbifolium]